MTVGATGNGVSPSIGRFNQTGGRDRSRSRSKSRGGGSSSSRLLVSESSNKRPRCNSGDSSLHSSKSSGGGNGTGGDRAGQGTGASTAVGAAAAAAATLPTGSGSGVGIESLGAETGDESSIQFENLSSSKGADYFWGLVMGSIASAKSVMSTAKGRSVDLDAVIVQLQTAVGTKSHATLLGGLKDAIIEKTGFVMIDGYESLCSDSGGASSSIDDHCQILVEYWGSDPRQYPLVAKELAAFLLLRVLEQANSLSDLLHQKKNQVLGAADVLVGYVQEKEANGIEFLKSFAHGTRRKGSNNPQGYRFLSPDYRSAPSKVLQKAFIHWFGAAAGAVLFKLFQYDRSTIVAIPSAEVDGSSRLINVCVTSLGDPAKQKAEILRTVPTGLRGAKICQNVLRMKVENAHVGCVIEKALQEVLLVLGVVRYVRPADIADNSADQDDDDDVIEIQMSQEVTEVITIEDYDPAGTKKKTTESSRANDDDEDDEEEETVLPKVCVVL